MKPNNEDYIRFCETHDYAKYAAKSTELINIKLAELAKKQTNIDTLCFLIAVAVLACALHWLFF